MIIMVLERKRKEDVAMTVAAAILERVATVDEERMLRALSMVGSGGYEVEIRHVTPVEVEGVVKKRLGKGFGGSPVYHPYLVRLSLTSASCTCPDALHRGVTCKHCVALALYSINHPEEPGERKPGLSLRKMWTEEEREQVKREIEELYGRAA